MSRIAAVALAAALLLVGCGQEHGEEAAPVEPAPETQPTEPVLPPPPSPPEEPVPPGEPAPPEEPVPPPPAPAPVEPERLPPPDRRMSWTSAGAFVWHETDVSPEALGEQLRASGFGWVALLLHDGLSEDAVEPDWVARFRQASGLPVGGWGVLRTSPVEEAALAHELVTRNQLDFYIANAEAEYGYTGPDGQSPERFERSRAFVGTFRSRLPDLPVGLSSYCRADRHDLDWAAWRRAGFVFLPQAYVNDFGQEASPAECVRGAASFFPPWRVHPTVGMYPGSRHSLVAKRYARLLSRAGTVGFSVYLAETRMTEEEWGTFGEAIESLGIARLS